ncbi:patatin-like phospholipase family protein [Motilibacter aurantiacus]|uniref:patatin-like phospholipase family protein n=1 Tax=Motilibacter aurantiacus TaxID=2714955 RepID=UPI00140C156C|nr:patatin-like phospholipase family protein [Motilibacter aurantiacus]
MAVTRGVALGAGGVLGAAWEVGALCALSEVLGVDARAADVLAGTSAGSVVAATLAAGVSAEQLRDFHLGLPLPEGLTVAWDHETGTGGARPARPGRMPASPALLARALRRRGEVPWVTALWAAAPRGRGSLAALRTAVDAMVGPGEWAPRPNVWIPAVDFATGERVVFGREGAPPASLGRAVEASCTAPLWFAPVRIGDREYVDGGVRSGVSVDLFAGQGLDELYVVAPLASTHPDRPASALERAERRWRRRVTRIVLADARRVAAEGTRVVVVTPGPEDLRAMGANLMDPARRVRVLETSLRTTAAALRRQLPTARKVA